MTDPAPLTKWPFLLGDALLLGLAFWIERHAAAPLSPGTAFALITCVATGALLSLYPFIQDHRAAMRALETQTLASASEKITDLKRVMDAVGAAAAHWQSAQDAAAQIAQRSEEMAARMDAAARDFMEFMKQSNDAEKARLRLSVEKLQRAEREAIEVVVAMLDQSHLLHLAAVRSGKTDVSQNIGRFHALCREIARRSGIILMESPRGSVFDAAKHRLEDGSQPAAGATVGETLAPGVTFQGQLLRLEMVAVSPAAPPSGS